MQPGNDQYPDCQDEDSDCSDTNLKLEENSLARIQNEFSKTTDFMEKLKKFEKMYFKNERIRSIMKIRHKKKQRSLMKRIKKLETQVCIQNNKPEYINKILNYDQYCMLSKKFKKIPKWCDATLIKAYQLKFSCGVSGYNELRNHHNYPLPSLRTLREKLQGWKFNCGSPDEIFEFLKLKVAEFKNNRDKDCLIVLDEISITPGLFYDSASGSYIGNVTLPGHDDKELATHVLVIIFAGVSQRWKQIIDYFYTGKSTDGTQYKPLLMMYMQKAHAIGLFVLGVVADMGSANQAMWRSFGVNCHRHSTVANKCKHPSDERKELFFFHDASHAFKNLKEGFLNCGTIIIAEKYVKLYNLPTNTANSNYFKRIIDENKEFDLKVAPKLHEELIEKDRHFSKMRVKSAKNFLSLDVSSALE